MTDCKEGRVVVPGLEHDSRYGACIEDARSVYNLWYYVVGCAVPVGLAIGIVQIIVPIMFKSFTGKTIHQAVFGLGSKTTKRLKSIKHNLDNFLPDLLVHQANQEHIPLTVRTHLVLANKNTFRIVVEVARNDGYHSFAEFGLKNRSNSPAVKCNIWLDYEGSFSSNLCQKYPDFTEMVVIEQVVQCLSRISILKNCRLTFLLNSETATNLLNGRPIAMEDDESESSVEEELLECKAAEVTSFVSDKMQQRVEFLKILNGPSKLVPVMHESKQNFTE